MALVDDLRDTMGLRRAHRGPGHPLGALVPAATSRAPRRRRQRRVEALAERAPGLRWPAPGSWASASRLHPRRRSGGSQRSAVVPGGVPYGGGDELPRGTEAELAVELGPGATPRCARRCAAAGRSRCWSGPPRRPATRWSARAVRLAQPWVARRTRRGRMARPPSRRSARNRAWSRSAPRGRSLRTPPWPCAGPRPAAGCGRPGRRRRGAPEPPRERDRNQPAAGNLDRGVVPRPQAAGPSATGGDRGTRSSSPPQRARR